MKLPVPKEEDGKRVMMMSGTSPERKGLICERRETKLVGEHAIQGVPFRAHMDLGSGDTSDSRPLGTDIENNYDSFNWDPRFDCRDFQPAHPTITKTHISGSATAPSPPTSPAPPTGKPTSSSSESVHKNASDEQSNVETSENEPADTQNSTLAVVEDSKQPNLTANESNPTVPAPTEPSKTSTLRLSDRTRSESEDDIEKMDEPEQDGALIEHRTLYKTTTTDNSPNSEKIDKNGNRSDLDDDEADNDCVIQCLYYTIQCCECIIF